MWSVVSLIGYVELEILSEDGRTHKINVLSAPYARSKLTIELTEANIELLRLEPGVQGQSVQETQFTPVVTQPNVKWLKSKSSLQVYYFDGETKKWMSKTQKILPIGKGHDEIQAQITEAATRLQAIYDGYHVAPGTSVGDGYDVGSQLEADPDAGPPPSRLPSPLRPPPHLLLTILLSLP